MTDITLESLRLIVLGDVIKRYGIKPCDLEIFNKLVHTMNEPVQIERAHYSEDLETIKPEDGNEESK